MKVILFLTELVNLRRRQTFLLLMRFIFTPLPPFQSCRKSLYANLRTSDPQNNKPLEALVRMSS